MPAKPARNSPPPSIDHGSVARNGGNKSIALHFFLIFGLGAAVWMLVLRFFFPGYLDPFVPFHIDHFEYLGRSGEGYGVMRYLQRYPRPIGNLLFDLLGRLGTRGMLVPVFALTLLNATLLIRYVERLTGRLIGVWTIILFFVLVFANPESYSSVKEDILAVVSLSCGLTIFHLWQSYLESGKAWLLACIVAVAFLSSYVKETYFATLVVFFCLQMLVCVERRKEAAALVIANLGIAAVSLLFNAKRGVFVDVHAAATGSYFQNWSLLSILHGYHRLLKFLIFPAPALLVMMVLLLAAINQRKSLWIGLTTLLFIMTTLFPQALLPNHLEDQYAWLGAFFFFTPVLLADRFLPKRSLLLAVTALAAIALCAGTLVEYHSSINRGMAGWLRKQEKYQRILLSSWPILKSVTKPREHELVIGPTLPFEPFSVPGYIRNSFGGKMQWTVVLPAGFKKNKKLTTEIIHEQDVTSIAYDHVFAFSPTGTLTGIYSRSEATAIAQAGGFPQFPALTPRPTP